MSFDITSQGYYQRGMTLDHNKGLAFLSNANTLFVFSMLLALCVEDIAKDKKIVAIRVRSKFKPDSKIVKSETQVGSD